MAGSSSGNNVGEIISNASSNRKLTQKRSEQERTKYFIDILEKNGVILSKDDRPHILTKEQSLVIRDLEKALTQNEEDDAVSRFIASFKLCSKKSEFLHKLLIATVLRKDTTEISANDSLSTLIQQESVIRIFFQINCIQSEIMEFILDEATQQVSEENEEEGDFRLMLNAMKYLPFINSSDVLTQKLLDMVEIGTFGAQLEIFNSIPEIIPDAQYESTAKQLIRILESNNNEVTGAIIDCLNSLNLPTDTRLEIQQYIVDKLLSSASIYVYPVLFDFLTSDCKPINLPGVLLKCRDALNEIMKNEKVDKEKESRKVVIMKKLHMSASLKVQYEGWMNLLINIRNFNATHKPVDIIIMAMLHSTGSNRKQNVEKLIKRHVKAGLLKKQHLEVVFQKYFIKQIFHDYFPSIIEIASSLLRYPADMLSTELASATFILLFENENMDRVQRQDIIHTLILLTSHWESKNVGDILKIMLDLSKGDNLKNHVVQLMGLLEKVDTFELKDIKQVYELLCCMTCSGVDEANSGLKDELHMLIRKQISSAKRQLKQRGIVAAIVMAKYIATTSEEQELSDNDNSIGDIARLPHGAPQESASLLELASNAATCIPELMGLYYDQLASMLVRTSNLDQHVMGWLQENVQREFEETFTIREPPDRINDIPIYSQYCLNDETEQREPFVVNIAPLTMSQSHTKSIVLLAPMFRMLRTLHQKQKKLGDIDALLGCGVALPELEDVSLYDTDQIKLVADSLFHCINWFRETVSAFIKCSNRRLRMKLIQRLVHLVVLEDKLNRCLERVPNHKLPASYFYNALTSVTRGSPVKTKSDTKISRPKKKMKTIFGEAVDFLNETVASTSMAPTPKKKAPPASSKRATHQIPKPDFREMDTDVIILLRYPLNLSEDDDDSVDRQHTTIKITAFQYVLSDIVGKINLVVNNKNLGMSTLNDINPVSLVTDCIKLSSHVFGNFKRISRKIADLKENVDEEDDHVDLYTSEAKILKNCFSLALEYFMFLFGWSGFGNIKNLNLLRDYLRALIDEPTSSQSAAHLSREVTNKLITCADQCLHLHPAVCLVKAMQALYKINPENHEIKKKITAVSGKFLNKKWYNISGDLDGGKVMYENMDVLLKAYLDGANIKTISGIVGTLQKQAKDLQTKDDHLEMLESINKASFHVLYRNLCNCTLDRITLEVNTLTNREHLVLWKTTGVIMQGLMVIVTAQSTKSNYSIFLRKSIQILNVFLSHGIPILEIMLKTKTDEVVEILKTLQTTTRFLHHLCCTSKLTKDAGIMAYVPKFRQTLETLMFRVKGALVANDCSAAFWMGNLKNKDLDGDEILTQSTVSTAEDSQNGEVEEEELPSEDSDGDILEQEVERSVNKDGEDRSASEVYD